MSAASIQHAFVSYVREDADAVDQLVSVLQAASIPVWRDTTNLWPGEDWQQKIREAIEDGSPARVMDSLPMSDIDPENIPVLHMHVNPQTREAVSSSSWPCPQCVALGRTQPLTYGRDTPDSGGMSLTEVPPERLNAYLASFASRTSAPEPSSSYRARCKARRKAARKTRRRNRREGERSSEFIRAGN